MVERRKQTKRDYAHLVAIICQAQGKKITAADITGEAEDLKREENKKHLKTAQKILKEVKEGKLKAHG